MEFCDCCEELKERINYRSEYNEGLDKPGKISICSDCADYHLKDKSPTEGKIKW
tara:strand:- start:1151 stop:1312 length:162 start_codon:yes stop_codon:yes gene_type:complete